MIAIPAILIIIIYSIGAASEEITLDPIYCFQNEICFQDIAPLLKGKGLSYGNIMCTDYITLLQGTRTIFNYHTNTLTYAKLISSPSKNISTLFTLDGHSIITLTSIDNPASRLEYDYSFCIDQKRWNCFADITYNYNIIYLYCKGSQNDLRLFTIPINQNLSEACDFTDYPRYYSKFNQYQLVSNDENLFVMYTYTHLFYGFISQGVPPIFNGIEIDHSFFQLSTFSITNIKVFGMWIFITDNNTNSVYKININRQTQEVYFAMEYIMYYPLCEMYGLDVRIGSEGKNAGAIELYVTDFESPFTPVMVYNALNGEAIRTYSAFLIDGIACHSLGRVAATKSFILNAVECYNQSAAYHSIAIRIYDKANNDVGSYQEDIIVRSNMKNITGYAFYLNAFGNSNEFIACSQSQCIEYSLDTYMFIEINATDIGDLEDKTISCNAFFLNLLYSNMLTININITILNSEVYDTYYSIAKQPVNNNLARFTGNQIEFPLSQIFKGNIKKFIISVDNDTIDEINKFYTNIDISYLSENYGLYEATLYGSIEVVYVDQLNASYIFTYDSIYTTNVQKCLCILHNAGLIQSCNFNEQKNKLGRWASPIIDNDIISISSSMGILFKAYYNLNTVKLVIYTPTQAVVHPIMQFLTFDIQGILTYYNSTLQKIVISIYGYSESIDSGYLLIGDYDYIFSSLGSFQSFKMAYIRPKKLSNNNNSVYMLSVSGTLYSVCMIGNISMDALPVNEQIDDFECFNGVIVVLTNTNQMLNYRIIRNKIVEAYTYPRIDTINYHSLYKQYSPNGTSYNFGVLISQQYNYYIQIYNAHNSLFNARIMKMPLPNIVFSSQYSIILTDDNMLYLITINQIRVYTLNIGYKYIMSTINLPSNALVTFIASTKAIVAYQLEFRKSQYSLINLKRNATDLQYSSNFHISINQYVSGFIEEATTWDKIFNPKYIKGVSGTYNLTFAAKSLQLLNSTHFITIAKGMLSICTILLENCTQLIKIPSNYYLFKTLKSNELITVVLYSIQMTGTDFMVVRINGTSIIRSCYSGIPQIIFSISQSTDNRYIILSTFSNVMLYYNINDNAGKECFSLNKMVLKYGYNWNIQWEAKPSNMFPKEMVFLHFQNNVWYINVTNHSAKEIIFDLLSDDFEKDLVLNFYIGINDDIYIVSKERIYLYRFDGINATNIYIFPLIDGLSFSGECIIDSQCLLCHSSSRIYQTIIVYQLIGEPMNRMRYIWNINCTTVELLSTYSYGDIVNVSYICDGNIRISSISFSDIISFTLLDSFDGIAELKISNFLCKVNSSIGIKRVVERVNSPLLYSICLVIIVVIALSACTVKLRKV